MAATNDVKAIYHKVIQDVCIAVREALSEEGYDEHTLNELRSMWSAKIDGSKAVEPLVTSAVDDATTRTNRRMNNSETNHSNVLNNRQATTNIRPTQLHTASLSAMTNVNVPVTTHPHINASQMNVVNPATMFNRPQVFSRPQLNASTMGNNPMTTSHQIDGTHDETVKKRRPKSRKVKISLQLDGTGPTASDDDDDDDDNEAEGNDVPDDLDEDDDDDGNEEGQEDPNPLCSDDDVSDDEPAELFETENVVVCQYDKISRTKNKWRFTLKSGVMNINGRDYVFSKATGDADW